MDLNTPTSLTQPSHHQPEQVWLRQHYLGLIFITLSFLLGLLFAWQIFPVRIKDTYPVDLRPDYRAQYILLSAEDFQRSGDKTLLSQRLRSFPEKKLPAYFEEAEVWTKQNVHDTTEQNSDQQILQATLAFITGNTAEPLVPTSTGKKTTANPPRHLRTYFLWVILSVIGLGLFLALTAYIAQFLERRSPTFRYLLGSKPRPAASAEADSALVAQAETTATEIDTADVPGAPGLVSISIPAHLAARPPKGSQSLKTAEQAEPTEPDSGTRQEVPPAEPIAAEAGTLKTEAIMPPAEPITEEATIAANVETPHPAEPPAEKKQLSPPTSGVVPLLSDLPPVAKLPADTTLGHALQQKVALRSFTQTFVHKEKETDTFTIRDKSGDYLGEFTLVGEGYVSSNNSTEVDEATAVSVELFDKGNVHSQFVYLVAPNAKQDFQPPEAHHIIRELSQHDTFSLESQALQADVTVEDVQYLKRKDAPERYVLATCTINVTIYQKRRLGKAEA